DRARRLARGRAVAAGRRRRLHLHDRARVRRLAHRRPRAHLPALTGLPRRDRSGTRHAMIEVHHLDQSRSHRVLWLLEELGLEYQLVEYQRLPSMLARPELKAIHPLGKSPVIRDGDVTLAESGAILEYLLERYGEGRLAPKRG